MRGERRLRVSVSKNQAESEIRGKNVKIQIRSKLQLLVVHIELLIDMWLISQIKRIFCFDGKWRY